jgi:hypothetical protein
VHAAYFHFRGDGLEGVLRRNHVSRMGRFAEVAAMVKRHIVIVAGDDFLIRRNNEMDAYGYVKRADPDRGRAL